MFKKGFLLILLSFILVSCGGDDSKLPTNQSTIVQIETGTGGQVGLSEEQEIKILNNDVKVNLLTLDIMNNVCNNLEGKEDFILEGNKKVPGKIETISFIENHLKEDKTEADYNEFVSLKNGQITGNYQKFTDINNLKQVFENYQNKEEFYTYLSNYMLFLDKGKYNEYKNKYLEILSSHSEEIMETPFIGIILAEYKQNNSCSSFIRDKFINS